ncbi:hypothetical protein CXB37_00535 [Pseudomonas syringae pv. syringae]|nr:hypothetical protein CXB37_00535 [Pseudomonas syringae pv. syringae]
MMDAGLRFVHALIVVGVCQTAMALVQGNAVKPTAAAIVVNLLLYFGGLKLFTGESVWTLIMLSVVSMILSYVVVAVLARIF